jgi:hypothetical protein
MIKPSHIQWILTADNPISLSQKMFELNYINQKSYLFSAPVYISDLKVWATWYNVDVLSDKPLDMETYSINPNIFDEGLRIIHQSQEARNLESVG